MNTDTDFPESNVQLTPQVEWKLPDEHTPNYHFRSMFRPKLLEFFELTNKKLGAYKLAEQKTKEWFLSEYKIPLNSWHFRNRKEKIIED